MSNTEQTLSIIKPDAVERNLTEEIKSLRLRIETLEDTQHDTAIDIGDSVKQLQVVTESIACGMAHK